MPAGYIEITPAAGNQVGAAWLDTPLDLNTSFDITLRVNLGNRDGNGADGLSIVFQNDPLGTDAVGDTAAGGEWVGMHTIYPAVSIEIDTYQNTSRGDPACDHIGINEFVNAASLPNHAGASPVCASASASNIEDGADHSVRLVWNSSTTTLTVYFDGVEVLDSDNPGHKVDVAAIVGTTPWFGVVGSTGGAYNRQQFKAIVTSSELTVTKTVMPGSVAPGGTVTYAAVLQNNGSATAFVTEIEDRLPIGFSYVPASSGGLTSNEPSIVGQALTWNGTWLIPPGGSAVLTFQAQATIAPGVYFNIATFRGMNFADISTGDTARVVVGSDLSTSTKSVVDLNGGDAWPNDILRYTITLTETAGRDATGIALTDPLTPDMTNLNLQLPLPPGAIDNSTASQIDISNITIPANGSVDVVFDVTVANGTPHGTAIDNTATITNPLGIGAAPSAPTVLVTNTTPPAAGSKPLYLYTNLDLSRVPPGGQSEVLMRGGEQATWTLNPSTYSPLTIDGGAGAIPVTLWIRGGNNRFVTLRLSSSTGQIGSLGPIAIGNNNYPAAPVRFDIPISDPAALVDISSVQLTVDNVSTRRNRRVYVHPYTNGLHSRIDLESLTVIHVEPVQFYDAPYPGGSVISSTAASGTIYIRARVSDPFGSFDISSATLTLTTPTGLEEVTNAVMAQVAVDANGPYKIYETAYPAFPATWPAIVDYGLWTAAVTAQEGTENLVRHTNVGTIRVLSPPNIVMLKSAQVYSDPVNGTSNPFAIPGAFMTYTVTAYNHGGSGTDLNSVVVTDQVPQNTSFYIGALGPYPGPVAFIDTAPLSGLTFDPAADLAFSIDGGSNFNLTTADLIDDGYGCDSRVTHIQVKPRGVFNGDGSAAVPQFTLQFRVRVQ
jgi:uncharacterized repeat protein (TIGR01451 family)